MWGMQVKFIYDHVFEPHADNRIVYKTVASPIVQSALDGINGTIFACGCCATRRSQPLGDSTATAIGSADVGRQRSGL